MDSEHISGSAQRTQGVIGRKLSKENQSQVEEKHDSDIANDKTDDKNSILTSEYAPSPSYNKKVRIRLIFVAAGLWIVIIICFILYQQFFSVYECDADSGRFPCRDNSTEYVWSSRSPDKMDWNHAAAYCRNLEEGGYDWRLPNIDELRTLVKNRRTASDGDCRVSEKNNCLASTCWNWETCAEACENSWKKCKEYYDGRYSKLGDGRGEKVWLWSSSKRWEWNKRDSAWRVGFESGHVDSGNTDRSYARCISK